MSVIEECVPPTSLLSETDIKSAYFMDSYSAPLSQPLLGPIDLFHNLFGHHPWWVKAILIARNIVAGWFGLSVARAADILNHHPKSNYAIGDTIGPWPIFALTENELIAGRDNLHLNFRLSVLKVKEEGKAKVILSTICLVNHWSGKLYLFFIIPFHKWGVQKLLGNAEAAGRL
jgi:hypothetical protein